ncbi:hypothetical protein TNCV_4508851, partial [Trichonephila clavipes]
MTAIGRAMESGRRGYGSSSGWKVLSFLAWLRAKRLLSDWMLGTVNIDSDWLPRGCDLNYGEEHVQRGEQEKIIDKN